MSSLKTWLIGLIFLLTSLEALGFSPILTFDGTKGVVCRQPTTSVTFYLHDSGATRILKDDLENIMKAAAEAWNRVSCSEIHIEIAGLTDTLPSVLTNEIDGINVIYFDKWGRIIPSGSGIIGVTYVFFDESGEIKDTDIIFNDKDYNFSMFQKLPDGTTFLQAVATHEMGHALGLDHSAVYSIKPEERPTMYPYYHEYQSSLEKDDEVGISWLYPSSNFKTDFGSIAGRVTSPYGEGIFGGHVVAIKPETGQKLVGVFTGLETLTEGEYEIPGLPPGDYKILLEPLRDTLTKPSSYNFSNIKYIDQNFVYEYYDDRDSLESADMVSVKMGQKTSGIDIVTGYGNPQTFHAAVNITPKNVTLPNPFTLIVEVKYPEGLSSVKAISVTFNDEDITDWFLSVSEIDIGETEATAKLSFPEGLPVGTKGTGTFTIYTNKQVASDSIYIDIKTTTPFPPIPPLPPIGPLLNSQ